MAFQVPHQRLPEALMCECYVCVLLIDPRDIILGQEIS